MKKRLHLMFIAVTMAFWGSIGTIDSQAAEIDQPEVQVMEDAAMYALPEAQLADVPEEDTLESYNVGAYSLNDITYTGTDIVSGKSFSFNGNNGKAAVVLFGGLSSCGNTMNAISILNGLIDKIDTSKVDIYLFDIKNNSTDSIKNYAKSSGWYTGFYTAQLDSYSSMYTVYLRSLNAAGITSSYTMPLIAYKSADGSIACTSVASTSSSAVQSNLQKIGITVASASDTGTYETIQVQFGQSEARGMLSLINNFRTGSSAWYWNEDNSSKTYATGLNNLLYDYKLEAVAMLRAAEIAYSYSHTRPNGMRCFTAYDAAGYECWAAGENIAAGYTTAESVFAAWREDDYYYSGQGHRRNMLSSDFMCVGIGHCVYNGRHFWVQEFALPNMAGDGWYSPTEPSPYINNDVLDSAAKVKIYKDSIGTISIVKATTSPTVTPKPTSTPKPTVTPTPSVNKTGWIQTSNGWRYRKSDGTYVKSCWFTIGGKKYHFDDNGYRQTGWLKSGGKWYYLDKSTGVMATSKWISNIYYVKSDGTMATSEWIGNYYVDANGKWDKTKKKVTAGWKKSGGKYWYQNADGTYPKSQWQKIGGKWYHFDSRGYMQTGWIKVSGKWYYLDKTSGAMATSKWISGTYYVKSNGVMATNEWVGGKYYVDNNGKWVKGLVQ